MEQINPQYMAAAKKALDRIKALETSQKWVQIGSKPCKMYKMEIDDRVAAKGVANVAYPIQKIYQFLQRQDSLSKLDQMCLEGKTILKTSKYEIYYMRYSGIWPVDERDFITTTTHQKFNETKYYIGTASCNYPCPEKKDVVRADLNVGGYVLEKINENQTKVTYFSDTDLKGSIPAMIKNKISEKQGQAAAKIEGAMKKSGL